MILICCGAEAKLQVEEGTYCLVINKSYKGDIGSLLLKTPQRSCVYCGLSRLKGLIKYLILDLGCRFSDFFFVFKKM